MSRHAKHRAQTPSRTRFVSTAAALALAVPAAAGPSAGAAEAASTDFEVCATYARGPRLFAAAARIRVTPTGATCSALRLA